ncbi:hypothetical protein ACIGFK_32200 [Streptomyces sp. NPDC085524]|uniref:hypothetical protein n=1 Tax=unclassified Streptomyces TaxID=2593676 RepID=UPI0035DA6CF8
MEHEQTIPELRKEAETTPDSDTPDQLSTPAADEAAAPAAPRRRGRTTLLIAGAAALGVLAGAVTGYAIQYHREPTPLPPLAQQKLVTPKALAPDATTTNKTINGNRWHKTDGDLRKLLIEAPKGAEVEGAGYESLDWFATNFEKPDAGLRNIVRNNLRRVATTRWQEGDNIVVEVRLLQFRERSAAEEFQQHQAEYRTKDSGNSGVAIPGVPDEVGHAWVGSDAKEKPGYYPLRTATAEVRRGDIVVEVFYYDKRGKKIAESDVIDLAKRQLERL